jgi:capsular exopolysaccharide synthesis family protein
MSRIQDILAKAERDGTARRTQTSSAFAPAPAHQVTVAPAVDGTAALDTGTFAPTTRPAAIPPPPEPHLVSAPARTEPAEPRSARATLHPALVAAIAPHSVAAEQYRSIRTRLAHREEQAPMRILMITSPAARDGKSITAANLGLTMAQELQRRIVLVDCDLRRGSVHSLFGVEAPIGLAEVLAGEATLDEALIHLPDHRLTVLPAGGVPQFPTELLGSSLMRRTLDTLRAKFDRVLLDAPAVLPLADVGTVAPMVDGVLMVVRAGSTLRPALDQAIAAFEEKKLLGLVLNDAR